ncbi:MAG TPA: RNA methyltransferase [Pyrinomonadaceae bacterium]|nr:RNA methyltransferase [Pyrinomonadaceae bacterium]
MITSRHNPLAQRARAVRDGRDAARVFVEGLRLCEEAARSGLTVEEVLFTERFAAGDRGARLLADLRASGRVNIAEVSEGVLASVSDTKTPQGVALVARRPATDRESFERALPAEPLLVVLHGVGNPSNAGAALRVAEAAGTAGVVSTAGSTDLLSPKSLRGSMGSAFRLPLWTGAGFGEVLAWCRSRGVLTVSTDLAAESAHTEVDWTGACAIVCGAEAGGLADEEAAATDQRVRIPMRPPVESLNVAVALAVVLYEAARQRGFPGD